MNINKISPNLLKNVNVLANSKQQILICSNNFLTTKQKLDESGLKHSTYKFANCFLLNADFTDINYLSAQKDIDYISENIKVCSENSWKDKTNIKNYTRNIYWGQNQTVCFIDTGVYPHLDFLLPQNRILKFVDLINKKDCPYDDNGHGTFVAGVACGNGIYSSDKKGFAPLAKIVSIKALDNNGASNSTIILDAMQWVWENYKKYNISVVCMSFGADTTSPFDPLNKGAEALWNLGITVVAACGNSGPKQSTIKSPGINPNIITVGAFDQANNTVANFSSRGPTEYGNKPDLLAPGVNVISCNNHTPPYTIMSGTSVATPIVAGICADILSKHKYYSNKDVKRLLISHCKKITGDINSEGAGILQL